MSSLTVNLTVPEFPFALDKIAALDLPTIGHVLEDGFTTGLTRYAGTGRVLGRAVTVRLVNTDSALVHYMTKLVRPGDFLVIDTGLNTTHAPLGGVMIEAFALAGCVGVAVDGACTDVEALRSSGISVFARSVSAVTTRRAGLAIGGGINIAVGLGGVTVQPGDLVIADDNGMLITSAQTVADVIDDVHVYEDSEPATMARLRAGEKFADFGLDAATKELIDSAAGL